VTEREILVVVPRGTKVLYMEADVEEVLIADTALFEPAPEMPFGVVGAPFGVPVYPADRYTPRLP
jgi:hypothetical protein